MIPVWTELAADYETPISAFHKLNDDNDGPCFLLESAERSDEIGRFSFLGFDPRLEIRSSGSKITIKHEGKEQAETYSLAKNEGKDPLHELEELMGQFKPVEVEGLPVFSGGAVGFLTYDMVRFFEDTVPKAPKDQLKLPLSLIHI